jgi:isoquinoline 1-oxidoreductase subunit alpha
MSAQYDSLRLHVKCLVSARLITTEFGTSFNLALWVSRIRQSEHRSTCKRGGDMIRFKVNGMERTYDGDPEMPLLWYLRDVAGFTGTKFGCGMSLCGACTVHQNGDAVRSCSVAMQAVSGTSITTIEGICAKELHPVQKAWMQIKVPQCGYCQTGQIMQAIALLNQNKNPSDPEIDQAMSGNLCRCGTYQRIRAAIHQAAKEMA